MAQATQYVFPLKEIAETMMKREGIKTGKWVVGAAFGIQVGSTKIPPSNEPHPSASVIVQGIAINRHPDGTPIPDEMAPLIVDAAELK